MDMAQRSYIFGVPNRIIPGTTQIRGHVCHRLLYLALNSTGSVLEILPSYLHIVPKILYNTACSELTQMITRTPLGRVAPIGWPRSVYKSDVECRFLEF